MIRISKIITLLVLRSLRVAGCLSVLVVSFNISAGTRIAIVSEKAGKLPDLLTAELSNVDGVELLDRSDIRKVLKEHKISAQMLDSKQALKLNKLLKTDLFVVIESEKKSQKAIGLVVFDANTGVRYWDSALPEEKDNGGNPPAKFATDAVKQALGKRDKALGGKLKYISLIDVRNADLPRDKDPFCKAMGIFLMRQLGNSPDIVVLERNYLDYVIKERNLGIDKFVNQLKNSNIILDLEVSKALGTRHEALGKENVQCGVFVQNKKVLSVDGDLNDSAKLANQLAAKLADYLKISMGDIVKIDKKLESRRLFREYRFYRERREKDEAYKKIVAWHALNPEKKNKDYLWELEKQTARNISVENIDETLDTLEFVFDLGESWYDGKDPYKYSFYELPKTACRIAMNKDYPKNARKRAADLCLRDAEFDKRKMENHYGITFDTKIRDFKTFKKYNHMFRDFLVGSQFLFEPIWQDITYPLYKKWLKAGEDYIQFAGKEKDKHIFPDIGSSVCRELLDPIRSYGYQLKNNNNIIYSDTQRKSINELLELMLKHPIQPIRVSGKCGLIMMVGFENNADTEYWIKTQKEIADFTKIQMEELGEDKRYNAEKTMSYYIACNCIDSNIVGVFKYPRVAEYLYDFMVARNELSSSVAVDSIYMGWIPSVKLDENEGKKYHDRAKHLLKMCKSEEVNVLHLSSFGSKKGVTSQVQRICHETIDNLNRKFPDLKEEENLPWDKVTTFDGLSKCNAIWMGEKCVYAILREEEKAILKRINLPSMKTETITQFPWDLAGIYYSLERNHDPTLIYKNNLMWGTQQSGLVVVPLDQKKKTFFINKKIGLNSNFIQAFTCINNTIYLAAGKVDPGVKSDEFNIYSFNMKSKNLKLLANSRRKTKETPFDNLIDKVEAKGMIADPERKRILMAIDGDRLEGIWEYNIETQNWKKIPGIDSDIENFVVKNNVMLLEQDFFKCALFNPESNKLEQLYKYSKKNRKIKFTYPKLRDIDLQLSNPYLLTENYLWSGGGYVGNSMGFCRVSLKDGSFQKPSTINPYGRYLYLNITKNGKYLITGDDKKLYIKELKKGEK